MSIVFDFPGLTATKPSGIRQASKLIDKIGQDVFTLPHKSSWQAERENSMRRRLRSLSRGGQLLLAPVVGGVAVNGCYQENGGGLRVVDTSKGVSCLSSEIPINWSQTGPPGPAGPHRAKLLVGVLSIALSAAGAAYGGLGAKPARPKTPDLGGSITLKSYDEHLQITLLGVENPAHRAYKIGTPDSGEKYVAVRLRIFNLSRYRYNDSPSNGARLISTSGAAYRITLPGKEPNLDEMAAIAPGDYHVGWLTFQVPITVQLSRFRFILDSGFVPQRGDWLLR